MNSIQLDRELEALRPLWRDEALVAGDDCKCGAWNEGECGCGNYVDTTTYVQRREIEYLRQRVLKANA